MKLLKTMSAALLLTGGPLVSVYAVADDSVFAAMDDPSSAEKPSESNPNAGYLAQSGNTRSSSLTADTTMTWYGQTTAWSLWGNANNASSNDEHSSEKYAVGGRSRYSTTDYDYLFGQASWLADRYNGYRGRDILTAGHGRQLPNEPVYSFRFEFGPGVRYDEHTDGATETQPLGYAPRAYIWQMMNNTESTQGVPVFGADDTTLNSETALNAAVNEHFGLKVAYNVTRNSEPPTTVLERINRRTTVSLGHRVQRQAGSDK